MDRAIIWDWGRTIYDSDRKVEYPKSLEILDYCRGRGYRMTLVSLAKTISVPERTRQIKISPLGRFFERFAVVGEDKDPALDFMAEYLELPRSDIWIIGDRMRREIRYANRHGHPSIWYQNDKFAGELPDEKTGQPGFIIKDLPEILQIL